MMWLVGFIIVFAFIGIFNSREDDDVQGHD
jgi:hypothetical protein